MQVIFLKNEHKFFNSIKKITNYHLHLKGDIEVAPDILCREIQQTFSKMNRQYNMLKYHSVVNMEKLNRYKYVTSSFKMHSFGYVGDVMLFLNSWKHRKRFQQKNCTRCKTYEDMKFIGFSCGHVYCYDCVHEKMEEGHAILMDECLWSGWLFESRPHPLFIPNGLNVDKPITFDCKKCRMTHHHFIVLVKEE